MGDMFQTVPLLQACRSLPDALASLLCVEEFSGALLPFGLQPHLTPIPASQAQAVKTMQIPEKASLAAIARQHGLDRPFFRCINCNHEPGVAALAAELKASTYSGRRWHQRQPLHVEGDWGRYLFAFAKQRTANLFNMADVYCGLGGVRRPTDYPGLRLDERARTAAAALLNECGWDGATPLVALQLGSSAGYRAWHLDEFIELAKRLQSHDRARLLITGGPGEAGLAEAFVAGVKAPVINCVGRTSLPQLAPLLSHCRLLITNDTGPMHVAALAGVRTLSIHCASAYFAETAPYADGSIVVHADLPCYPCFPSTVCETARCKRAISPALIERISLDLLDQTVPESWDAPGVGICETRYLANGTLGFLPRSREVPLHLVSGFVNRAAWEQILDVAPDASYRTQMMERLGALPDFTRIRRQTVIELSELSIKMGTLARLTGRLQTQSGTALQATFAEMKAIERLLDEQQNSPYVFFHLLELNTMDEADPRRMLQALQRLYTRRQHQFQAAATALEALK
jgi:hypothetical protein